MVSGDATPQICKSGKINAVQLVIDGLTKQGYDMVSDQNELLYATCLYGHWGLLKYLIKSGFDIKSEKNKFWMIAGACESGKIELFDYLQKNGCELNKKGFNDFPINIKLHLSDQPLDLEKLNNSFVNRNSLVIIKFDNEVWIYRNYRGSSSLNKASSPHLYDSLDFNMPNQKISGSELYDDIIRTTGHTIWHYACRPHHLKMIKHLVKKGYSLLGIHENNLELLVSEDEKDSLKTFKYLLSHGVDIKKHGEKAFIIILWNTWKLLRDSVSLLLDAIPHYIDQSGIATYLSQLPGVTAIHDLHIWGLSTREIALTAHLVMPQLKLNDADYEKINVHLKEKFKIDHATLQVETGTNEFPCEGC